MENCGKYKQIRPTIHCSYCGAIVNKSGGKYCSSACSERSKHEEAYDLFLKHPELYNRGNYTPKAFRGEFLKEQGGVCAICGCEPMHNGKPLTFVIDHINGDASDNRRENLRVVCPNCDSQLDTFKSKNKNSTRRNYWKEHLLKQIQ